LAIITPFSAALACFRVAVQRDAPLRRGAFEVGEVLDLRHLAES
jgi:hypothetical protein